MRMQHLKLAGAVALLALLAWSPGSARADALLTGFQKGGSPGKFVDFLNPVTLGELGKAITLTPDQAVGIAVGNGNVYVSYNSGSSGQIARYDLNGNFLSSIGAGGINTVSALAFDNNTLYVGLKLGASGATFIDTLDPTSLLELGKSIHTPDPVIGLAVNGDNVYATFDDGVAGQIARYDLDGNLLNQIGVGNSNTVGPLAFGNNTLYVGFELGTSPGTFVDMLDPTTLAELGKYINLTPNGPVGLAFGDDSIFVSYDDGVAGQIARYDLDGNLLTSIGVGNTSTIGPLAYLSDASVRVPEPAPLAGLGIGLLGLVLVRRQRVVA